MIDPPESRPSSDLVTETSSAKDKTSGAVVNSALYGDSDLTFQIPDCCFDLTCTGLVQTSSEIALSAAIEPISTFQSQYCINVRMFLDVTTGIGWLYGNNKPSGYWPGNLFSYLTYGAISVEWGDEVYSPNVRKTPHTKTAVGSGYTAENLNGFGCFINNVRIVDFHKFLSTQSG
ncbi:uncharacterized protein LOC110651705 [Hevea brasiliensis]|uniref:uncharacterized protein LOC110651705 n=1 Tax=Hevea brasiliensis TaxID=3981 RepID=UPI0025F761DD|nr:uncharacterized protein LOC110651705 [Hevea brasiliensis]